MSSIKNFKARHYLPNKGCKLHNSEIVFLHFQNTSDLSYMADRSFQVPNPVQETSVQDEIIEDIPPIADNIAPQYEVIMHGTNRGKKMC